MRCRGDEDRTTQGARRRALTRAIKAHGDVEADLSELVFTDSSLMVDLAMLARRLRVRGGMLRVRGAQPQVRALIEVAGLHRLPGLVVDAPVSALG